jgi:DNA-binding transcriptional LysR family regulator
MVVALPIGHPLARETGPIALSALRSEGLILYRRADGPGIQDVLFAAFLEAGFTPRVTADVPRLLSAVTLVAAGKGIAIVPETLRSLHRESVKYRQLDTQSSFTAPLTLVYRCAPQDSPLSRFIQMAHGA